MDKFPIHLTPLAEAFAKRTTSVADLEARVHAEIAECMTKGLSCWSKLSMHTFEVQGQEFICFPKNGAMRVDTCSYKKGDKVLDQGPFKGMEVMFPTGDSDD